MNGLRELLDAFSILSGSAALGAVIGWVAAMVGRVFGRSLSFSDWVTHGAGLGGLIGLVVATAFLARS